MQHLLPIEGYGVRLRPVRTSDARFIVWVRNQEYAKGKLGDSAMDIASQEAWLADYFDRAGDYYFIVETLAGTPLGTHGIYGIAGATAESGRYVMRPEVVAAVPSSILAFDLAFGRLNLHELIATCVATNHTVHSLNRKFGFKQTKTVAGERTIGGQPVEMVHFSLLADDWPAARARLVPLATFAEAQILEWEKKAHETCAPFCRTEPVAAASDATLISDARNVSRTPSFARR